MAIFTAIVVEIIGALLILTICFAEVGVGLSTWKRLRAILKFSLPLVPGYIADLLLSFSDRLIIAAMLGSEAIGIYAAAYTLARLMREIFVPINTAMLPVVSRAWDRGDHDQARWVLSSTMRYFLLVAIPAWVGISLVGADLLDILATSTVGRPTAQLIPFIGLGLLVSSLQQVYTIVMQLTERTSALAATKLIIAFFYIVLVFYAVPRWGLLGGAIVTAIGYVLDLSSSALLAARHGRIFPDLGNIVKQGIAAALMIPAVLLISAPGIPGILLKVMMGLAVYLVSLILIGGIGRRELQFLKSIVTRHESRA